MQRALTTYTHPETNQNPRIHISWDKPHLVGGVFPNELRRSWKYFFLNSCFMLVGELTSAMDKLDTALKATSYNIVLQMTLRASSFIMNAIILRYIQAELLGVVNMR